MMPPDERDLISTAYTMALIELGYRVTRWMIENAPDPEDPPESCGFGSWTRRHKRRSASGHELGA